MQFFSKTNINFIGARKFGYGFSILLIVIGLGALIAQGGPNYSIDFLGGVSIRVMFEEDVNIGQIRTALGEIGYGNAELKQSTIEEEGITHKEFIIRVKASLQSGSAGEQVLEKLRSEFGENNVILRSNEAVGPKIGSELKRAAIYAILVALLLILIYISWRFELRYAVGAIIPLFHDVLITLGVFAILDLQISLAIVAAFLTIVGYSLNDTIVVFDRIRENLRNLRRQDFFEVVNVSINETLSRTFVTSLTTLIVVLILFIFGGEVIHNFAFALLIGILIGTYSSIFVASPVLVEWENWQRKKGKVPAKVKTPSRAKAKGKRR